MQCSTLYPVQISINKWHTALLSTLCAEFWGTNIIVVPSTNSGGRVPPFTRDLCLWLVLCLTYIAHNVMVTMKISTKCMCSFNLKYCICIRILPVTSAKKISKTIRILHVWKSTDLQIRILPEADVDGVTRVDNFSTWRVWYIWDQFRYVFLEYGFGTWEVPFRYIIKSITVHFKRNFATRLACSAAGLQMLNWCLVCYAQHNRAT